MNKEELTKGLQEEKRALELTEILKEKSPVFIKWLEGMLYPFMPHGRWIMDKYQREDQK